MVSVLITIALLLQSLVTVFGLPMCPKLFTSITNISETEVMAKLRLSPTDRNSDQFDLNIQIAVVTMTYEENISRVQLEKSKKDTIQELNSGHPIVYNVYLPKRDYFSYVNSVTLNSREYCTGSSLISIEHMTLIELEHILSAQSDAFGGKKNWIEDSNSQIRPTNPYLRLVGLGVGLGFVAPVMQRNTVKFPMRSSAPSTDSGYTETTTKATSKVTTAAVTQTITEPATGAIGCGTRANVTIAVPLIVIGEETLPGDWPWLVAIFVVKIKFDFQCAGSLVTNRHVITAAHCMRIRNSPHNLPASTLAVALGRYQLHDWREEGSDNRHVLKYTIHHDYAFNSSSDSDIAILVLWTPVEFSPTIRPICLWSGPISLEYIVDTMGYVVGWGQDEHGNRYSEMPRKANLPIVSQTECLYSNEGFIKFTSFRTFCAGSRDGGGPCNGDSGSGLVLYDEKRKRYQLRGVVSLSLYSETTGCDLTNYVVFVDIAKYLDWINEQISTT